MSKKSKKVSFRVKEEKFRALRESLNEHDETLSSLFQDYVDSLVKYEGCIKVIATDEITSSETDDYPPTVTVSKRVIREHERMELEVDHLREQLGEHKNHISHLHRKLEEVEATQGDMILLEDLDKATQNPTKEPSLD